MRQQGLLNIPFLKKKLYILIFKNIFYSWQVIQQFPIEIFEKYLLSRKYVVFKNVVSRQIRCKNKHIHESLIPMINIEIAL